MGIIYRISLFTLILITIGALYPKSAAYKDFLWIESDQFFQVDKVRNCELIYTSASSNFSQNKESDQRKLSQFIDAFYPDLAMEAFNIPASHLGYHYKLLRLIPEKSKVQTVICAINIRSFGADWRNSELETTLNKQAVMYSQRPAILNRLLLSLNAYDNKEISERVLDRTREWDEERLPYKNPQNSVNNWCRVEKWGDWQNPKRQLADQFIKQYAFVIDETNPRIQDLDAVVILAKKRGWNLVLSILPENIEIADSLVGNDLTNLIFANSEWIKSRYSGQTHITVLNNVNLLSSDHFTDKDFPTEHYDVEGRKIIAAYIAFALRKNHGHLFSNPAWASNHNFQ